MAIAERLGEYDVRLGESEQEGGLGRLPSRMLPAAARMLRSAAFNLSTDVAPALDETVEAGSAGCPAPTSTTSCPSAGVRVESGRSGMTDAPQPSG